MLLTDVGLHMNLVSWLQILGAAITCSSVQPTTKQSQYEELLKT